MKFASLLIAAVIATGCLPTGTKKSPTILVPVPDFVRNAPEAIDVGGYPATLGAFAYRDFMPVSPPDGKPLRVGVSFRILSARFVTIWVVRGNLAWVAKPEPAVSIPEVIAAQASPGPKWGPNESVDVAVRLLLPDGRDVMLAARGVNIQRTD